MFEAEEQRDAVRVALETLRFVCLFLSQPRRISVLTEPRIYLCRSYCCFDLNSGREILREASLALLSARFQGTNPKILCSFGSGMGRQRFGRRQSDLEGRRTPMRRSRALIGLLLPPSTPSHSSFLRPSPNALDPVPQQPSCLGKTSSPSLLALALCSRLRSS